MSNKIILTPEQEKALQLVMKAWNGSVDNTIESHSKNSADIQWQGDKAPLNDLSTAQVSRALLLGYEVEPQYKVGDWVTRHESVMSDIEEGQKGFTFRVDSVTDTHVIGEARYHLKSSVRHSAPQEIKFEKEKQMWAKLGRKVGEFKEGDTIVTHIHNQYTVISDDVKENASTVTIGKARGWFFNNNVIGFTPTGSYIDFKEGME